MNRFNITLTLILLLVFTAGLATADRVQHDEEKNWTDGPGVGNAWDQYGIPNSTYYKLWSSDNDTDDISMENESNFLQNTKASGLFELVSQNDASFETAPTEAIQTWHLKERDRLRIGGNDASYHPPNVNITSGPYVKDAYVTEYAFIPSSVILHRKKGQSTRFVSQKGELLSIVDYRVTNLPTGYSTAFDKVTYTLGDTDTSVTLIDQNENIHGRSNGRNARVKYQLEKGERYRLRANITLTIEKNFYDCVSTRTKTIKRNGNTTTNTYCVDYDFTHQKRFTYHHSTTSRTLDVEPVSYRQIYYATANYTHNDELGVYVSTSGENPYVNGYLPELDKKYTLNWEYFTNRKHRYDTVFKETKNGKEKVEPRSHPIQLHAYPDPQEDVGAESVLDTVGREFEYPIFSENFSIMSNASKTYTSKDSVAVKFNIENKDEENLKDEPLRITGLVNESRIIRPDKEYTVKKSHLTTRTEHLDNGSAKLTFHLEDNEGKAINLKKDRVANQQFNRDFRYPLGSITIQVKDGADNKVIYKNLITDENGNNTVIIPKKYVPGVVKVEYNTEPWWQLTERTTGYTDTSTIVNLHKTGDLASAFWLLAFLFVMYQILRFVLRHFGQTLPARPWEYFSDRNK